MSRLILANTDYESFDTTAGNLATTLDAIVGKQYNIKNGGTGGNILTVTYGSTTQEIHDGELFYFLYDGAVWSMLSGGTNIDVPVVRNAQPLNGFTEIPEDITQAYTNLVTDPTDLTTGNWLPQSDTTVSDSGQTINGFKFWKVKSDLNNAFKAVENVPYVATSTIQIFRGIAKKNTSDESFIVLRNNTTAATAGQINIESFASKTIGVVSATILEADWIDDDTVSIIALATGTISVGNSLEIRLGANRSIADQTSTLWSQPQITEGSETRFPFIDGSKSADVINETFTMSDKFTFVWEGVPNFAYDIATDTYIMAFFTSGSQRLLFRYDNGTNSFRVFWQDTGTIQSLQSQIFDDGTSLTNINQRLRIIGSFDLSSGGINDSRFIVIPLESGALFEDSSWSGTPNVKVSTFPTLSIGHLSGSEQADSSYEYLRIYNGLLVGDVTNSDDVTNILSQMSLQFDAFPNKYTDRTLAISTPLDVALQLISDDTERAQNIQDEVIRTRHLSQEIITLIGEAQGLPIGATYIQFPGDDDPSTMGLIGTWSNVSSELAGDFIRFEGGLASTFESGQQLDQLQGHWHDMVHAGSAGSDIRIATESNGFTNIVDDIGIKNIARTPSTDGVNGIPRTGTQTWSINRTVRKWRRIS